MKVRNHHKSENFVTLLFVIKVGILLSSFFCVVSLAAASSTVESLKKSLDQVILLRHRVSYENIPEDAPICRILDDGLRAVQRALHETVMFQDTRPKIITEHEPTIL